MKEECLICKAPLEYLNEDVLMECAICHKKELSKTRCVNGHYVCNECHTKGIDSIFGVCLTETSKNPVEILNKMMNLPFCHMHGPEHHIVVGAALLTAYKNAGGDIDLSKALTEMKNRGQSVPGGACGFWGACGAGISSGMFVSPFYVVLLRCSFFDFAATRIIGNKFHNIVWLYFKGSADCADHIGSYIFIISQLVHLIMRYAGRFF